MLAVICGDALCRVQGVPKCAGGCRNVQNISQSLKCGRCDVVVGYLCGLVSRLVDVGYACGFEDPTRQNVIRRRCYFGRRKGKLRVFEMLVVGHYGWCFLEESRSVGSLLLERERHDLLKRENTVFFTRFVRLRVAQVGVTSLTRGFCLLARQDGLSMGVAPLFLPLVYFYSTVVSY